MLDFYQEFSLSRDHNSPVVSTRLRLSHGVCRLLVVVGGGGQKKQAFFKNVMSHAASI